MYVINPSPGNFFRWGFYCDICHLVKMKALRKTTAFLICMIFMLGAAYAQLGQDSITRFYYPSGKLSSEGTMVKGKPDGYWKSYYENGQLKSEGNRLNFKLEGEWKFYTDSGVITSMYNYHEGLKHGLQKTYYP